MLDKSKNNRLIRLYGITLTEYNKKLKQQNGVCWICKKPPKNRSLHVDHRHVKGFHKLSKEKKKKEVRGLLCFHCNRCLGTIEHPVNCREVLDNINEYFSVYKMKGDK